MAGFGIRLKPDELWTEEQTAYLFALGQQYSEAVIKNPFEDILGHTYQEIATNFGKKHMGQYFTPASVAGMMAQIQYERRWFEEKEVVLTQEPASGSGVMVLQFLKTVFQDNPDYLQKLSVSCIDLDVLCVQMTTVQILSNNLIHELGLGQLEAWQGNTLGDLKDLELYFGASTQAFMDRVLAERSTQESAAAQESVLSSVEGLEEPSKKPGAGLKQKKASDPLGVQIDLFD